MVARPGPDRVAGRGAGAGLPAARTGTLRTVSYRPPPREMRASDADRDGVISLLSDAAADGRLTMSEHAERVGRAHSARTLGDLAVLTSDLAAPSAQPFRLDHRGPVLALFNRDRRDGRWGVPPARPGAGGVGGGWRGGGGRGGRGGGWGGGAPVCGGPAPLELIVPEGVAVVTSGTAL